MDFIFDSIFGLMMAWNQVGLIFGGLLMLLIGGALIGWAIYSKLKKRRVRGRIVGIKVLEKAASRLDSRSEPENKKPSKEKIKPIRSWADFREEFKKSPGTAIGAGFFLLLFVGLPLLFFCIGLWLMADYAALRVTGVETQARIVRMDKHSDSDGTTYHAIASFYDRAGRQHEVRDSNGYGWKQYEAGNTVALYYAADDPNDFALGGLWPNLLLPVAFCGIGGAFLFFIFFAAKGQKGNTGRQKQSFAGEMYYPVFEYKTQDDQTIRGGDGSGSSAISTMLPGKHVTLFVDPQEPEKITRIGFLWPSLGLVFAVPGLIMLYIAFTSFEFNIFSVLLTLGLIGFLGFKASKFIKPRDEWETKLQFKARMTQKRAEKDAGKRDLSTAEIRERLAYGDKWRRVWLPVMVVISCALIAGSYYLGRDMNRYMADGVRTSGEVVEIVSKYSSSSGSSSYTYFPVVEFTAENGHKYRFRSRSGSNPPLYSEGDEVEVLYDPQDPDRALIDHGLLNWAASAGCLVLGILLLFATIRGYAGLSRRKKVYRNDLPVS